MENNSRRSRIKEMNSEVNSLDNSFFSDNFGDYGQADDAVSTGITELDESFFEDSENEYTADVRTFAGSGTKSSASYSRSGRANAGTAQSGTRSSRIMSVDMSDSSVRSSSVSASPRSNAVSASSRSNAASASSGRQASASSARSSAGSSGSSRVRTVSVEDSGRSRASVSDGTARKGSAGTGETTRTMKAVSMESARTRSAASAASDAPRTRTTAANKNYSDMVEERKLRSSGSSGSSHSASGKKSRKKKSGMSGFKKFVIFYIALWLIIIIVGSIIFNSFLAKSESLQPVHIIEAIVEKYSSAETLTKFLSDYQSVVVAPEGIESNELYVNNVIGKEISFVADNQNTTSSMAVYKIKSGGTTVTTATLKQNGTSSFGLTKWGLASLDITAGFPDLEEYSILVPENSTVTVGGKTLTADQIIGTELPEALSGSSQYLTSVPMFSKYGISVVKGTTPEISATDASGTALEFSLSGNDYVAIGNAPESFVAEVKPVVEEIMHEYGTYFIGLTFNLSDYILSDSEIYAYIFGSDEYNRIDPSLYLYEIINTAEFTSFSSGNYIKYSDDCFTVDVNYTLYVTFYQDSIYGSVPDDERPLDATWVMIKRDGSWYIADIIYK